MINRFLLFFLFTGLAYVTQSQSSMTDRLASLFHDQLLSFPQEKIYLHTDKPYYISGERIWFRAHLADAATHIPAPVSRYVYVELINPLDSVVTRIKILHDEAGAYHGCLPIPEDVPEGNYTMRAYTTYMRNLDEHYFCTKAVRIGDPQARTVQTDTQFMFEPGRQGRTYATFRFSHIGSGEPLVPKSVRVSVNSGRMMDVKVESDGTAGINFNLPATSRQRTMLLEVTAFSAPYRQYIQVPAPDSDFDVSFYPEGGSMIQGAVSRIAFKAMKSDGQATGISGTVYDRTGTEIRTFKSEHSGMGSFNLIAEKGKTYYAVCENDKGQSKRFDLPVAAERGYALSVSYVNDSIYVRTRRPAATIPDEALYLLAHTRGSVHFAVPWNHETNLAFAKRDQFPSGVLHLILFDAGLNPVSERLIFINNPDQAHVDYQPDMETFVRRSPVKNRVTLTGMDGEPLTGNFSVSVTSDREVTPDSTSSILTTLLLTSDLRGTVENPAYYFQNGDSSVQALDLLMLTQGWRRYDIAEMVQGRFARPAIPLELFPEISGTVRGATLRRPVAAIEVTMVTVGSEYFDSTTTDKDGRFSFRGGEFPDSTELIVHAVRRRGMASMELFINEETFPQRTLSAVPATKIDRNRFAQYAHQAELMYIDENGMRVFNLPEITVTAQQKPPIRSVFYSYPDYAVTQEDIERMPVSNILDYFVGIPGVLVDKANNQVLIRGIGSNGYTLPLLVVDDVICQNFDEITSFTSSNIAQIDVLKGGAHAAIFGMRGGNGVIIIHTRRGETYKDNSIPFHVKSIIPLGYQQPVEFYVPKYDTPERQNAQTPDLRTAIHWQPVVQTDDTGEASFEFYTADAQTSYTVIIEGLADDGSIIRQERKLFK